jgi:hypothetical protein
MAPLPPIWDPAKAVDRLPQPYRMIDKLLAEIVEKALDTCLVKEKLKRHIDATHIDVVGVHRLALMAAPSRCTGPKALLMQHEHCSTATCRMPMITGD